MARHQESDNSPCWSMKHETVYTTLFWTVTRCMFRLLEPGRGAEELDSNLESSKSRTTKMIVKNVPFEATKKDVRDLFGCVANLGLMFSFYYHVPRV